MLSAPLIVRKWSDKIFMTVSAIFFQKVERYAVSSWPWKFQIARWFINEPITRRFLLRFNSSRSFFSRSRYLPTGWPCIMKPLQAFNTIVNIKYRVRHIKIFFLLLIASLAYVKRVLWEGCTRKSLFWPAHLAHWAASRYLFIMSNRSCIWRFFSRCAACQNNYFVKKGRSKKERWVPQGSASGSVKMQQI